MYIYIYRTWGWANSGHTYAAEIVVIAIIRILLVVMKIHITLFIDFSNHHHITKARAAPQHWAPAPGPGAGPRRQGPVPGPGAGSRHWGPAPGPGVVFNINSMYCIHLILISSTTITTIIMNISISNLLYYFQAKHKYYS